MSNPFTSIIGSTGRTKTDLLELELKGVVSPPTFYNLVDEAGIPDKAQWETVKKVAQALGYEVVFQKADKYGNDA